MGIVSRRIVSLGDQQVSEMTRPIPLADLAHVLDHTRDVWNAARGARIFLTGGTGFFGVWLAESFAHANESLGLDASLVVLSRDPEAAVARVPRLGQLPGVTFRRGDVRQFDSPAGRFTHVIHGAAESSQQSHAGDHRHMFDTIVDGTRRTLTLARESGAQNYLLLSSGAVYGPQPADVLRLTESYGGGPPLHAASAYGEGKRAAEVLAAIEAERGELSVRVARCFAFVGPRLPLSIHFAIGNFLRDAMRGGPLVIQGDGTAVRSYLYMADLAIWLWTIALGPAAKGAYNVGSEVAVSILETARAVAGVCAPSAEIVIRQRAQPNSPVHRYVPSTDRARTELGLTQQIEIHDAIERTARWYSPERVVRR
jgi:nucleoside-diphosphate-sugar epimerase